jgi:hypothetical protein
MRRFSLSWSLASEAIRVATFATREPWLLIGLLAAGTVGQGVGESGVRRSVSGRVLDPDTMIP